MSAPVAAPSLQELADRAVQAALARGRRLQREDIVADLRGLSERKAREAASEHVPHRCAELLAEGRLVTRLADLLSSGRSLAEEG